MQTDSYTRMNIANSNKFSIIRDQQKMKFKKINKNNIVQ